MSFLQCDKEPVAASSDFYGTHYNTFDSQVSTNIIYITIYMDVKQILFQDSLVQNVQAVHVNDYLYQTAFQESPGQEVDIICHYLFIFYCYF